MRKGWEYKKLNEVCEKGASNIVINKLTDNSGEYPLFGASGLVKNIDFFHQDKPYIGIVKDGAGVGRVNIYPAYSSLVGTMQYIFPKEGYSIDFIKYFLVKLDLSHCVSGATIPHIYFKDYGKENIPTPSLATQLAIVSELDKINELIRLKKEQLKDFDNLAQSLFYEMFGDPVENEKGWEVKKLGEVGELARGVSKHRPRNAPELLGGSMPLIQTGDVANSDFYITKYSSTYSKLGVEQSRVWEAGTLCITIAATIGKCAILGFTACFPDSVVGYKPNNEANAIYMYFIFKNMQKMLEEFAPGVAQKNINLKILSNLSIPLPPLSLQRLFAQRIEQIEREKSEVQKSIQDLETLLASRMQYWFE